MSDVEITSVSKSFGRVRALREVSLTVAPGQFFSLLGPSGCGKSTLLRLIGGFERPDAGRIAIHGRDVTGVAPNRRPTALVFQRWALFPHMSAADNIGFGPRLKRLGRRERDARVGELLELVGLAGLGDRRPAQLSGGQQQRVALARALAISPKVLLLDEPLSSLDLKLRLQMQLELKRLQREVGTTFLYVTHDQGEALTMSDAIAVVNDGRLEQLGTPREIYDRPASGFVANFIGDTNLFDVTPDGTTLRAGGVSFVPPSMPAPAGAGCAVSLRYERVRVGREVRAGNRFAGRVREAIFSGASVRYLVALDGGELTLFADVAHDGGEPAFVRGEAVEVGWDPDAAVVVAT
ncbi:ABC transporter ATP-binding protein [Pseudonocardia acaciae]|uniref:ABC transporter ATP-binding protein n=1 Tax=Pseudonocardia acaciae TaxID=551276 RepID=UPI000559C05E|nr:ABC transporter ATP-binding protein [Pseudonocardia acaciae]